MIITDHEGLFIGMYIKIKSVVLGKLEGDNRKGRPYREWLDDIKEWCQKGGRPAMAKVC